jgi:hypothetical protein
VLVDEGGCGNHELQRVVSLLVRRAIKDFLDEEVDQLLEVHLRGNKNGSMACLLSANG